MPQQFGLTADRYCRVSAVAFKPSMWGREEIENDHHGKGVLFLIDGAHETRQPGACLFPSILKSEFHGIRSVIEAYSNSAQLEGFDGPHACGVMLDKGASWNALFRVTASGRVLEYKLDRWD